MELYVNSNWTECYGNSYIAEAIAWSENGNHATIYTMGTTAKEADDKLLGALRELKLIPKRLTEVSGSKRNLRRRGFGPLSILSFFGAPALRFAHSLGPSRVTV